MLQEKINELKNLTYNDNYVDNIKKLCIKHNEMDRFNEITNIISENSNDKSLNKYKNPWYYLFNDLYIMVIKSNDKLNNMLFKNEEINDYVISICDKFYNKNDVKFIDNDLIKSLEQKGYKEIYNYLMKIDDKIYSECKYVKDDSLLEFNINNNNKLNIMYRYNNHQLQIINNEDKDINILCYILENIYNCYNVKKIQKIFDVIKTMKLLNGGLKDIFNLLKEQMFAINFTTCVDDGNKILFGNNNDNNIISINYNNCGTFLKINITLQLTKEQIIKYL